LLGLTAAIVAIDYTFDELNKKYDRTAETTKSLTESTVKFKDILNELDKSLDIENGVKSFKLTADELENLKSKTVALIGTNEAKIKQLQKDNDLTVEQKEMLKSLVNQNKSLHNIYNRLEKQKPYNETTQSAEDAKKAVISLSKEQIKYYEKRVIAHQKTITKLQGSEQNLANKILKIQQDLHNKLKNLETSRINSIEDINSKIHSINMSGEVTTLSMLILKNKQR